MLGERLDPSVSLDTPQTESAFAVLKAQADLLQIVTQMVAALSNNAGHSSELGDNEEEEEVFEPKLAKVPDPKVLSSEGIRKHLDVDKLPEEQSQQVWEILEKHQEAFAFDGRIGKYPAKVPILTKPGVEPFSLPMYHASPEKRKVIDTQIDTWFEQGIIEESVSPWAAPVVIVYRNGKPRFCVDYRKLNAVTIPDEFPIPRQSDILATLAGAQFISTLDALSGFQQMGLKEEDIPKSAF